jgi:hypothetical protein
MRVHTGSADLFQTAKYPRKFGKSATNGAIRYLFH